MKITTIKDYRLVKNKGLNSWEGLLEKWGDVVERYSEFLPDDASYLYTEISSVGNLAAAAWLNEWVAITEFQCEKGRKYRPKWNGRADLYLYDGKNNEFWIEAKDETLSLGTEQDFKKIIHPVLSNAIDDAKKTSGKEESNAVGVAFFRVKLHKTKEDDLHKRINELIEYLEKRPYHAAAWCFPKETRYFIEDNEICPGTIMVANHIDYQ
ncbi:MAG: hypothetical protein HQL77_13880 [Magnetococcales bacterium]|nr:hypothetical protein [Magnetococcales bacterium]